MIRCTAKVLFSSRRSSYPWRNAPTGDTGRTTPAGSWGFGLVTTVLVSVGINLRTAGWDPGQDPERWRAMRRRWEAFQGIRSWAFLVSLLLLLAAVVDGVGGSA